MATLGGLTPFLKSTATTQSPVVFAAVKFKTFKNCSPKHLTSVVGEDSEWTSHDMYLAFRCGKLTIQIISL